MSHVTTVDVEFKDLDALASAAESLGLILVRDANTYKWYGRYVGDYDDPRLKEMGIKPKDLGKCDHKLSVVGNSRAYEIGLKRVGDSYRLLYDFFAGGHGLMSAVSFGENSTTPDKLVQAYQAEVAAKELKRKGYRVSRREVDGKIRLAVNL